MEHSQGYCRHCRRTVMAQRDGVNHILHLLLSLFLCGLWIPVWIFIIIFAANAAWFCPVCGGPTDYDDEYRDERRGEPRGRDEDESRRREKPRRSREDKTVRFFCACGASIRMRSAYSGRTINCPKCRRELKVPSL